MNRILLSPAVLLAVALGCLVACAQSPSSSDVPRGSNESTRVPHVPRFPLGLPAENIPEWDGLDQSCKGTRLSDIRPCMQSFVDFGSILGLVTLVDDGDFGIQIDAVGNYETDTIFQIMSMTKPFVAVAILKLVEQGRIPSIESRVAQLPGLDDFPYRDITIRQLLTHTSGVWYWKEPSPGIRTGIAPHLTNRLEKEPSVTIRDKSLDYVASHYADPTRYPLELTTPQYSNIGYLFLGWIVERISGHPFEQFIQETILTPLALTDTFFFPNAASPAQRARIARLDRRLPDPLEYEHYDELRPGWEYPSPAGGLYSTASDLRKFLLLFRHRGAIPGSPRLLSEESIELLIADQIPDGDNYEYGCNAMGWSLGFAVIRAPGCSKAPGLRPGTIAHTGRFSTDFWYDTERDQIGIFLYQIVTNNDSTPSLAENDAFKQMLARITEAL
jgi:CubicO group peptidase (beta-lactamase class C family)